MKSRQQLLLKSIPYLYALFGIFWILITDWLVFSFIEDPARVAQFQTAKGWLFVVVSTLLVAFLLQITIRQTSQAQEVIAKSEATYRLLFENNPLPMWVYSLDTLAFLAVNEAAVNAYGFTREEFAAMTLADIRPPEDVPRLMASVAQTTPPLNFAGEWRHRHKNGTVFPVEITSHAITYNGRAARLVVANNISERKSAEEALRESEARFRRLAENAPDLIYRYRFLPEPGYEYVNATATAITGYTPEEHYQDPQLRYKLVYPEDRPLLDQVNQGQLPVAHPLKLRWTHKNGGIVWVEERNVPIFADDGRLIAIEGIARDITSQVQVEENLRTSERSFRMAVTEAPFPTIIHAEDGEVLALSRTWTDITGYKPTEILTINDWTERAYGERQNLVKSGIDKLYYLNRRVSEGEFVITCADGSQRIWDFSSTPLGPLPDGRRTVISVASDMTERKQAEAEREALLAQVRAQAEQLTQLMVSVPAGVLLLDADCRILVANPQAEEQIGWLAQAAIGDRLQHLGRYTLSDLLGSPASDEYTGEIEVHDRILVLTARPLTTGPLKKGWVLILREVTEERAVQRQLQEQERLAAIGQLAAGIAHDFNNILAVIILYAQLLEDELAPNEAGRGRLATIVRQAGLATSLIQQILDFSRRSVFEQFPVDLLSLLKEETRLLQRILPEHISVSFHYEAGEYIIRADPTRIQQTIINLAVNARDAMPNGGKLHFDLSHLPLAGNTPPPLSGMKPGNWILLTISDTGSGMPEEVLEHLFEPFFTTKQPGQGTGLGLAQVHGIVGQHGGHIAVNSAPDQGTEFSIYLPAMITESATESADNILDAAFPLGNGELILVVEDQPVLRQALVESLSRWQYRSLEAGNGEEALALLETRHEEIAAIVSDVVMPHVGGEALAAAMHQRGWRIPIILIAGEPLTTDASLLQAMGVRMILAKPLPTGALRQALAAVLQ